MPNTRKGPTLAAAPPGVNCFQISNLKIIFHLSVSIRLSELNSPFLGYLGIQRGKRPPQPLVGHRIGGGVLVGMFGREGGGPADKLLIF
jgi:hypothetical protein